MPPLACSIKAHDIYVKKLPQQQRQHIICLHTQCAKAPLAVATASSSLLGRNAAHYFTQYSTKARGQRARECKAAAAFEVSYTDFQSTTTPTLSPNDGLNEKASSLAGPSQPDILPVMTIVTETLASQVGVAEAAAALAAHLPVTLASYAAYASGVVRLEVPVARGATALQWLVGQEKAPDAQEGGCLAPRIYFSGRHSAAPDTPKASRAEAATRGWTAVAGVGAAWRWQGTGCQAFDGATVKQMQRFLSPDQPRVRILGGTRFNSSQKPSPEWEPFGAYLFILPLLEYLEVEGGGVLAVTVAWDSTQTLQPSPSTSTDSTASAHHGMHEPSRDGSIQQSRVANREDATSTASTSAPSNHNGSRRQWQSRATSPISQPPTKSRTSSSAEPSSHVGSSKSNARSPSPSSRPSMQGSGALSLSLAVAAAAQALARLQPAASCTAPTLHAQVVGEKQTPTEAMWHMHLASLLQALGRDVEVESMAAAAAEGLGLEGGSSSVLRGGLRGAGGAPLTGVDLQLARQEYLTYGQQGLDDLLAAFDDSFGGSRRGALSSSSSTAQGDADSDEAACPPRDPDEGSAQGLSKVVMARRSSVDLNGPVCGLWLLEALQERDPRAYQLYLSDGCGTCFVGSTPERLYARTGSHVASEAVAGTRPRGPPGDVERDFWLSLDLLKSPKDHAEFVVVRDWIRDALAPCTREVDVEVPKSVLKQGSMQHLYGRLAAELRPGMNDAHLLAALHPTPAVCGRPREDAQAWLAQHEEFDRGFYAGPFGWVSGAGAEFAVAIRSALVQHNSPHVYSSGIGSVSGQNQQHHVQGQAGTDDAGPLLGAHSHVSEHTVHLYAGVGVVAASDPAAEWQELDLKTRPFWALLRHMQPPIEQAANINLAWCGLLVEELCRHGASMFCIAPGSRSSPLAMAAALHPRARLNVCLDERSLGFWALGYGRAARSPAVVITSSGTAVANLLPSVVEASLSGVPLLLVTADRPGELRDTGANQTIDQVKIFGGFTRWFQDVQPPLDALPGRAILTTLATAMRHCLGGGAGGGAWGRGRQGHAPGPVHLNLQLREPLAPVQQPWSRESFLAGLARWSAPPYNPFTRNVAAPTHPFSTPPTSLGLSSLEPPPLTPTALPPPPRAHATEVQPAPPTHQTSSTPPQAAVTAAGGVLLPPGWSSAEGEPHGSNDRNGDPQLAGSLNGAGDTKHSSLQGLQGGAASEAGGLKGTGNTHQLAASSLPLQASLHQAAPLPPTSSEIRGLLALLTRAQRGLVVVGEQADPGDVVAAAHVASYLGWPVAADVLSGLRLGGCSSGGSTTDGRLAVVHHMDHLLLDQSCWETLKPDVILQLGPRITSKRMGQFMEWCAGKGGSSSPQAARDVSDSLWVYVDSGDSRHDPGHLVTHRATMPLPTLAHTLAAHLAAQQQLHPQRPRLVARSRAVPAAQCEQNGDVRQQQEYCELLLELDGVVGHEVDAALQGLGDVSEPLVARVLSRDLPPGHGLFLGNSMPIRDMDMYAAAPGRGSSTDGIENRRSSSKGSWVRYSHAAPAPLSLGVPVAANRGASGIDGVLSTAAGFAEGLARPCTLVLGDLSFLHDINGLSLLRAGEARPPLTVVLVNNGGGGIFSFLPIASALPEQQFTQLWATPQNVDMEGMCRAHGIPHQRASTPEEYQQALNSAWGLNRHSVVEVVTGRSANVDVHRMLQQRARQAAQACLALRHMRQQQTWQQQLLQGDACITGVAWSHYKLPLARPLTTALTHTSDAQESTSNSSNGLQMQQQHHAPSQDGLQGSQQHNSRRGLLVRVCLCWGGREWQGVGEVAPLPGLHKESLAAAEAALAVVANMAQGVRVPSAVCLLGGRLGHWMHSSLGVEPDHLPSSVRFGFESAVLSALAAALGTSFPDVLQLSIGHGPAALLNGSNKRGTAGMHRADGSNSVSCRQGDQNSQEHAPAPVVAVNGLVSSSTCAEAVAAAQALVAAGYTCIKVKVARGSSSPEEDGQTLAAVRAAVGPSIALRADANCGWSLEEAVRFASKFHEECGGGLGCGLEYVEEPVQQCIDLPQFYALTGMPYALDESLDDGSWGQQAAQTQHGSCLTGPIAGLAGLVVKPASIGSIEATLTLAATAAQQGIKTVISSCFESPLGSATLAAVAATVDCIPLGATSACSSSSSIPHDTHMEGVGGGSPAAAQHGLGTLQWFQPAAVGAFLQELGVDEKRAASFLSEGPVTAGCQVAHSNSSRIPLTEAVHVLEAAATFPFSNGMDARGPSPPSEIDGVGIPSHVCPPSFNEQAWEQTVACCSSSSLSWGNSKTSLNGSSASNSHGSSSNSDRQEYLTFRGMLVRPGSSNQETNSAGTPIMALPSTGLVVLLHGFLGASQDWRALVQGLAALGHTCLALDLPGHGDTVFHLGDATITGRDSPDKRADKGYGGSSATTIQPNLGAAHHPPLSSQQASAASCSIEECARLVATALQQAGVKQCGMMVGYSLGARMALSLAVQQPQLVGQLALVSGTPGIKDPSQAAWRARADDRLAHLLRTQGMSQFLHHWYAQPLWRSLRKHPQFPALLARRGQVQQGVQHVQQQQGALPANMADALSAMSTGRMCNMWPDLPRLHMPVSLIAGAHDTKFVTINSHMQRVMQQDEQQNGKGATLHIVPGAGHAVHVEQPLLLLQILSGLTVRGPYDSDKK